ncbi:MAG: hypothetical protein K8W52_04490 [Deltaproteobacteria bacterium]|nr:hypothetical protein [Deltaproteobacteria bacterium]
MALLAAGGYFAIDAGRAAREVSDVYASGGAWAQAADADARGRRDRTLAIIGLASGGAALAASAALYWLGRGGGEARHVVIAPGRTRTDVVVTWQF